MTIDLERADDFFGRLAAAIVRRRWIVALASLAAVIILGAGLSGLVVDTSQESWFLEGSGTLEFKRRFEAIFGKNDYCVVLARSEDLLSPESLGLVRELSRELESEVPFADEALSLTDFEFVEGVEGGVEIAELAPADISSMTADDVRTLAEKVLSRDLWRNLLLSEDLTQTLISLRLKPTSEAASARARHHPDYLIGEKVLEIISRPKYAPLSPRASGLPVIDYEKRVYFASLTPALIGMSILIIAVSMAFGTRDPRMVGFPLIASACGLISVFGLEGHFGVSLDPTTAFLPVFLALAMSTCYTIHVITQFQAAFRESGDRRLSVSAAMRASGWSLASSAATTMAGLLSFLIIPMRPLRWVGLTSAALIGAVFLLVCLLTPVFLSFGKDRPAGRDPSGDDAPGSGPPEKSRPSGGGGALAGLVARLSLKALANGKRTLLIASLATAAMLAGIPFLEVSFDLRRTYGAGVPYIERMIEVGSSDVGSLYSYGVAVELASPDEAKDPLSLKSLKALSDEIEAMPLTKRTTSLADIVEDLNQALNDGDPRFKRIPDTREEIAQELLLYESAGGAEAERWVDYDYQRLRLQVEVDDYNSATVMDNLDKTRARAAELFPGAAVGLAGALSEFTVAMQHITWGQVKTFFLALCAIFLVMALTFRSLKIALVAMIPNAVPVLAVSGLMGWAGVPLDIMTVTIVPMLLGLAVDDTIHLVNHALSAFKRTGAYASASAAALKSVGRAVALTSIVLILAFSPYLASKMNVFRNMGLLIGAGILAALLADLLVTPAILAAAKAFGPEKPK